MGYEAILGGEVHQSIIALFNFRPIHLIDINIGPGIVLPSEDESMVFVLSGELALAGHLSDHIHLGPLLDFGWSTHGFHFIAGIHCGINF
ncbi:MAG: hypothetical protein PF450_08445 [Bacteroidales bacterium]|nr:hypothetical protein [Bacteroidales bacterium]